MDIKDQKELKALIQMCRKQGVTEFTAGNFSCKLGPLPAKPSTQAEEEIQTQGERELDELVGMPINPTDDQLMNWAHPMVDEDQDETGTN